MKKIILIGYMGSGKSTIGKLVADSLQLPFIDLDLHIEDITQLTISEIFQDKGEIYFRKLEHTLLKELIEESQSFVLSLGGGTPCYANNHLLLQQPHVKSFYLKANINTLESRLKLEMNHRPLLNNVTNLKSFIGQHLFERSYFYNYAQHTVFVDNKSPITIAKEIIDLA